MSPGRDDGLCDWSKPAWIILFLTLHPPYWKGGTRSPSSGHETKAGDCSGAGV